MFEGGMWIIFLEMGLVLVLAAFIVWWTWPRAKKPEDPTASKDSGKPEDRTASQDPGKPGPKP